MRLLRLCNIRLPTKCKAAKNRQGEGEARRILDAPRISACDALTATRTCVADAHLSQYVHMYPAAYVCVEVGRCVQWVFLSLDRLHLQQ